MLKKTISYTDFNEIEHTEDFYFNLSKAELVEMELTADGNSFAEQLKKVIESNNGKLVIQTFKDIIAKAYGVKSEDGKRFIKSAQLSAEFEQTEAYSVLFVELVTDAGASAAFVNSLVPKDLAQTAESVRAQSEASMQGRRAAQSPAVATIEVQPELPTVAPTLEPVSLGLTKKEIEDLPIEELRELIQQKRGL